MLQKLKPLISILKRIWSKIVKIWRGFNTKQKLISITVMFFVILPMFIVLPLSKLLSNNNSSSSNNYSSQDYQYKSFEELKTECEATNNIWWPDTSECITTEEANTRTAEINQKLAEEEAKKKQEEQKITVQHSDQDYINACMSAINKKYGDPTIKGAEYAYQYQKWTVDESNGFKYTHSTFSMLNDDKKLGVDQYGPDYYYGDVSCKVDTDLNATNLTQNFSNL